MPIYFGFAETTGSSTSKWITPEDDITCNVFGWNDGIPTDLSAASPIAWATGRYYALKDSGSEVYQKSSFAFTTVDTNYKDATYICTLEMAMMGMTETKVGYIDSSIATVDTNVDTLISGSGIINNKVDIIDVNIDLISGSTIVLVSGSGTIDNKIDILSSNPMVLP